MRRLIGFLIVVAILLVVADRAAWWVAQRGVAEAIQSSADLTELPEVNVAGFPFLTQAIRGRYEQVDGTVRNLTVEDGLTISTLDVRLRRVHVKTGDLIRQQVTKAPVDSASARASVSYESLDAVAKANIPSQQLSVNFGQGKRRGTVSVTGTLTSELLNAQINGQARVVAKDGELVVGLLPESLDGLPAPVQAEVVRLLGDAYKLPRLPLGFKAKDVTVGPEGVTVLATAKDVVLG